MKIVFLSNEMFKLSEEPLQSSQSLCNGKLNVVDQTVLTPQQIIDYTPSEPDHKNYLLGNDASEPRCDDQRPAWSRYPRIDTQTCFQEEEGCAQGIVRSEMSTCFEQNGRPFTESTPNLVTRTVTSAAKRVRTDSQQDGTAVTNLTLNEQRQEITKPFRLEDVTTEWLFHNPHQLARSLEIREEFRKVYGKDHPVFQLPGNVEQFLHVLTVWNQACVDIHADPTLKREEAHTDYIHMKGTNYEFGCPLVEQNVAETKQFEVVEARMRFKTEHTFEVQETSEKEEKEESSEKEKEERDEIEDTEEDEFVDEFVSVQPGFQSIL